MKAVILAGGTGTRLWPLSRSGKPKQFQKLISEKTMLQETLERLNFLKREDIYISTNQKYLPYVREQCPEILKNQLIVEPEMRDTAPAIGYAAMIIEKNHPGEVMAIVYSDHLIKNNKEFAHKLKVAESIAKKENSLNIIEVKAKAPNPNLGYVKIGKLLEIKDKVPIYELKSFIEKPNQKKALQFFKSYNYLWNTGYYVWKAKEILSCFQKYEPKTYHHLMEIKNCLNQKSSLQKIRALYRNCHKISIDYAIMEKVPKHKVRIIPAEFGWSDVGSWNALYDELSLKPAQNITHGKVVTLETNNSLIYNHEKKIVAMFGIDNMVVINTPDVLLLCDKDKSPEIKKLMAMLQKHHKRVL